MGSQNLFLNDNLRLKVHTIYFMAKSTVKQFYNSSTYVAKGFTPFNQINLSITEKTIPNRCEQP